MSRVVHFEIHADDTDRASKFYSDVFGWQITKWDGPMDYWMIKTGDSDCPGIDGGLMKRRDPEGNVYNTIGVENLEEFIKKVESSGGEICVPTMAIPGIGWLAYFKDTEGNVFGMMQPDENAK